jgi:hypothetical protein
VYYRGNHIRRNWERDVIAIFARNTAATAERSDAHPEGKELPPLEETSIPWVDQRALPLRNFFQYERNKLAVRDGLQRQETNLPQMGIMTLTSEQIGRCRKPATV